MVVVNRLQLPATWVQCGNARAHNGTELYHKILAGALLTFELLLKDLSKLPQRNDLILCLVQVDDVRSIIWLVEEHQAHRATGLCRSTRTHIAACGQRITGLQGEPVSHGLIFSDSYIFGHKWEAVET